MTGLGSETLRPRAMITFDAGRSLSDDEVEGWIGKPFEARDLLTKKDLAWPGTGTVVEARLSRDRRVLELVVEWMPIRAIARKRRAEG